MILKYKHLFIIDTIDKDYFRYFFTVKNTLDLLSFGLF